MQADLEKLQGTWRVIALRMDGRDVPAADFAHATIVIDGDRFVSKGMGAVYEGTLRLQPRAKPKAFEMRFTAGHADGVRNAGIYRFDGDNWTICLATRGSRRPGRFASTADSGIALETFTRGSETRTTAGVRQRERTRQPSIPAASGPIDGEWQMTAGVFNGAAMSADMVRWCRRITRDNITTVMAGPQTMLKAAFALDPSSSPHHIDYDNLEGSNARRTQAGIFRIAGGVLEICMAAPGKARPSEFSSSKGDGRSYTVWKKA